MPCSVDNEALRALFGFPLAVAREPLPRPTVEVTPASAPGAPTGSLDVTITRDGKTIAKHQVDGGTTTQIVRDTAEKLIGDRRIAEALP